MTKPLKILPALYSFLLAFSDTFARAQEGGGGGETGEPLYGYLACGALAAGAIFALCKSARRAA
jgi:hypothetical protein